MFELRQPPPPLRCRSAACLVALAVLVFSCVTVQAQRSPGSACTTPNRQGGQCVLVAQCPPLAKLLKKGNPTQADRQLLRESLCGFSGQTPVVCCPSTSQAQPSSGGPGPQPQAPVATGTRANDIPWDSCGPSSADRITGGNETVVFEMPWIVRLGYRGRGYDDKIVYKCGGTLITNRYVLTASHCVKKKSQPVTVRLGEHNLNSDIDCSFISGANVCAPAPIDIDVEAIITHPQFTMDASQPNYLKNDIALLRLRQPVQYTDAVQPICLPQSSEIGGLRVVIAGWGKTMAYGKGSRILMKAFVPVVAHDQCAAAYRQKGYNVDPNTQLCAGAEAGIDSCNGDSGGPLSRAVLLQISGRKSVREVLHGVVSFGLDQCGTEGIPAVYTRVSEYLPWIKNNMKP